MTVLDNFIAFARALPADRMTSLEDSLCELMNTYSDEYDFTAEELADLRQRSAELNPKMSDPADIEKLFGRPLPR